MPKKKRALEFLPVPLPLWKAMVVLLKTAQWPTGKRDRKTVKDGLAAIDRVRAEYNQRRRLHSRNARA